MKNETDQAGETRKDEGADRAPDMRGRFAEQIKRFWRQSMKKNDAGPRPVQREHSPPNKSQ